MTDAPDTLWVLPAGGDFWEGLPTETEGVSGQIKYIRADLHKAQQKRIDELEAVVIDVAASLIAAISLLESGGKSAAPSDRMFDQTIEDYKKSLSQARAALQPSTEGK